MALVLVDLGAAPASATAFAVLPAGNPEPPANEGPEFGKASPIALVVIVLLALATVMLIRSMTKRIKALPASFDDEPPATSDTASGPDGPGSTSST